MRSPSTLPATLNKRLRKILERNVTELAMAHGNLLSANSGEEVRSILITSSHAGDGKTSAAISLAYAASRHAHQRVLLIDGNATAPALHELMNTALSPGLTDIVFDNAGIEECVRPTELASVSVMPYGHAKTSSLAVFRSPAFASTVDSLKERYDLVILDGPALLVSSDASFASPHFDGVILVIACEDTQWGVAQHVKEKIESVGGRMLGVVLNRRKYYVPRGFYGR